MPTIQAPSKMSRIYQGPYGNLSLHKTYVKLKAAAVDTVIELADLPISLEITGVRVLSAGLGTDVKLTVKSAEKVLVNDLDVARAVSNTTSLMPYYVGGNEADEKLTATVTGAAATGELHVLVEYTFIGY